MMTYPEAKDNNYTLFSLNSFVYIQFSFDELRFWTANLLDTGKSASTTEIIYGDTNVLAIPFI